MGPAPACPPPMTRLLETVMKARYIFPLLLACVVPLLGQKPLQIDASQRYLLLDTFKTSTLQRELDQASAAGFRVAFGDTAHNILILEKTPERYQYRVTNLSKEFDAAVAEGYAAVPTTFGSESNAVIMEKKADAPGGVHDYHVIRTVRTKTLQKELNEGAAKGYELTALSSYMANTALMEKRSAPPASDRYLLLATTRTGTMQKEINDAVAKGYGIVLGSGGEELMMILEKTSAIPEYLVLATARSGTLEKEINDAAARGYRPVPRTLAGINKSRGGFSFSLTPLESCIIMEKVPQPEAFTYKIIGTKRTGTFAKELAQAAAEGFEMIGFSLTYEEQLGLLRRAAGPQAKTER